MGVVSGVWINVIERIAHEGRQLEASDLDKGGDTSHEAIPLGTVPSLEAGGQHQGKRTLSVRLWDRSPMGVKRDADEGPSCRLSMSGETRLMYGVLGIGVGVVVGADIENGEE